MSSSSLFAPTRVCLVRLPKGRRVRERAWEIINLRSLGQKEGAQNYRTWFAGACVAACAMSYEIYHQWLRVLARGDSCEACDASRRMYRERLKNSEVLTGGHFGHKNVKEFPTS